jgi:hypothetical protein
MSWRCSISAIRCWVLMSSSSAAAVSTCSGPGGRSISTARSAVGDVPAGADAAPPRPAPRPGPAGAEPRHSQAAEYGGCQAHRGRT